jgi:hypothetical protein
MSLDQSRAEAQAVVPKQWRVASLRPPSLDAFREALRRSNEDDWRFIITFSRAPLFGRGGGHHSPLGGYLEDVRARRERGLRLMVGEGRTAVRRDEHHG